MVWIPNATQSRRIRELENSSTHPTVDSTKTAYWWRQNHWQHGPIGLQTISSTANFPFPKDQRMLYCPSLPRRVHAQWRSKMESFLSGAKLQDTYDSAHVGSLGLWTSNAVMLTPPPDDPHRHNHVHGICIQTHEPWLTYEVVCSSSTRTFGWSNERTQGLVAGVRKAFRDHKNHVYSHIHFIYGQKPKAT